MTFKEIISSNIFHTTKEKKTDVPQVLSKKNNGEKRFFFSADELIPFFLSDGDYFFLSVTELFKKNWKQKEQVKAKTFVVSHDITRFK